MASGSFVTSYCKNARISIKVITMKTPKKNIQVSSKNVELNAHDQEHKKWNRRSFLQALGLVGGGSIMLAGAPISASRPSPLAIALNNSEAEDRILLLIRLKGGNDGLNTIVPIYDFGTYESNRPTLKFARNTLYELNSDFGIPEHMNPLQQMWGEGQFKVVHGVGYSEQNLSHFRSSDIWASGEEIEYEDTGVFGRYFENLYPDYLTNLPEVPPALQIGSIGNLIFAGSDNNYAFSVSNPDQLSQIAQNGTLHDINNLPDCTYGEQLGFMRSTANTTFTYAGVINQAYENSSNTVTYGEGDLAQQLAIIARMIKGGLGTKVYLVTLDGFDTHAGQTDTHQELMTDLTDSISKFYEDLKSSGWDDKVLSITFSEFGRRSFENGSKGTDHGAAAPALLFGPPLNGNGFVGEHPDLSDLDEVLNLKSSIDFRQLYATVLKEWMCLDNNLVDTLLLNGAYENLSLGFDCSALSVDENPTINTNFFHVATYKNSITYLEIKIPTTQHIVIKLYDVIGQEVGTIKNEMMFPGSHQINIKQALKKNISSGHYIYRISTNRKNYSKSIILK